MIFLNSSISTFSGFMSLWISFLAWINVTALTSSLKNFNADSSSNAPGRMWSKRLFLRDSKKMYNLSSNWKLSTNRTMLGWESALWIRISRFNALISSGFTVFRFISLYYDLACVLFVGDFVSGTLDNGNVSFSKDFFFKNLDILKLFDFGSHFYYRIMAKI